MLNQDSADYTRDVSFYLGTCEIEVSDLETFNLRFDSSLASVDVTSKYLIKRSILAIKEPSYHYHASCVYKTLNGHSFWD